MLQKMTFKWSKPKRQKMKVLSLIFLKQSPTIQFPLLDQRDRDVTAESGDPVTFIFHMTALPELSTFLGIELFTLRKYITFYRL